MPCFIIDVLLLFSFKDYTVILLVGSSVAA